MPKTRLISPGSIPNHRLLKNLQLQGNYISNDGGDEGITIQDDGDVIINGDTKLYLNDAGGEYLNSDGTDLTIASGNDMTLDAEGDIILDAGGDDIIFNVGGVERGRLNISAGIGVRLQGVSGKDVTLLSQGSGDIKLDSNTDIILDATGNVGIGVSDPDQALEVNGDIHVANTVYFTAETDNACDSSGGSESSTIDWNVSQKQNLTITGTDNTIDFTNPAGPCNLILKIIQGDGDDTITAGNYHTNVKWAGGAKPTLSTANGAIDIVSFYFDGTSYHGVGSIGFATV